MPWWPQVKTPTPTVPYMATLLSYGCDTKDTWLRHCECWQADKDGMDDSGLVAGRWSPTAGSLTWRPGCTWTCCCMNNWYRTTLMFCWCCCKAGPRSTSWTRRQDRISRTHWGGHPGGTKSQDHPLQNSCIWKTSWLLQGPNTCSMPLSWDLTLGDCDSVAYLSPRHLGTVKTSLRFAMHLPATTTLKAYAQYDNLVVISAYCTVTFEYSVWCPAGNFWRPSVESPWRLGCWLMSTPGMNIGPCQHTSQLPIWSTQIMEGCWVTLGVFLILEVPQHAEYFDFYGTTLLESIYWWLWSMGYQDIWYSTKNATGTIPRVLQTLQFLLPGHSQIGCAIGCHNQRILGIQLCLQWRPDQTLSEKTYTCI